MQLKNITKNRGYIFLMCAIIFSFFVCQLALFTVYSFGYHSSAYDRYLKVAMDIIIPFGIVFLLCDRETQILGLKKGFMAAICYEAISYALKLLVPKMPFSWYEVPAEALLLGVGGVILLMLVSSKLNSKINPWLDSWLLLGGLALFTFKLYYFNEWFVLHISHIPMRYGYILFFAIIALGAYLDERYFMKIEHAPQEMAQ